MNKFGIINFNKNIIVSEIAKRANKKIEIGSINWQANSYHIHGKDIENAKQLFFDRINKIDFEDRTFNPPKAVLRSIPRRLRRIKKILIRYHVALRWGVLFRKCKTMQKKQLLLKLMNMITHIKAVRVTCDEVTSY